MVGIDCFIYILVVCVGTTAVLQLPDQRNCYTDSDCNPGECCGIRTGPLLVSKRQIVDTSIQGTCKSYLAENQYCWGYWKQNGDCGCPPSMECKYFPPSIDVVKVGKRRPAPGQHLCKPTEHNDH